MLTNTNQLPDWLISEIRKYIENNYSVPSVQSVKRAYKAVTHTHIDIDITDAEIYTSIQEIKGNTP